MKFQPVILCALLCYLCLGYSQPKYNNNWYFGDKAALDFNTDPPTIKTDSKSTQGSYSGSITCSTVSDEITGELLFYSGFYGLWNRYGELITDTLPKLPYTTGPLNTDVIILPLKKFKNRFIVFKSTSFVIVDMMANNGKGDIIEKKNISLSCTLQYLP